MEQRPYKTLGYEQLAAAASTALNIPAGTAMALIVPETQAIRWRDDGTAPTAAVGMPLAVGQMLEYTGAQLSALRVIEQAASTKVNVTYYGLA